MASAVESELCDIRSSLLHSDTEESVLDILQILNDKIVTRDLLTKTMIGKTVTGIAKKWPSSKAAKLSAEIVVKWKAVVAKENEEAILAAPKNAKRERNVVSYNEAALEKVIEEKGAKKVENSYPKLPKVEVYSKTMPLPKRNGTSRELIFVDYPNFRPNLTPAEVMQMGSFGGTYWRPIKSGVTGQSYEGCWRELPQEWLKGLDIKTQVASSVYRDGVNKYGVKCGGDLHMWESSGWISDSDVYGWFQWYCRFYQGRRTSDDARQVARGLALMGPKGRFRNQLLNKIISRHGKDFKAGMADYSISPVIRQTLQHWGFEVDERALEASFNK